MASDLLTLLMRIEWQGDDTHFVCPSCRCSRMHGHGDSCELQKQIKALHASDGQDRFSAVTGRKGLS